MSIEDPTLVSAYLDGSLDDAQREGMEAALVDNAELRQEVESLASLREWLGRLPRPTAPTDVSELVASRVHAWSAQRKGLARVPGALRPWLILAPLAAAAGLLLTLWLTLNIEWNPAPVPGGEMVAVKPANPERTGDLPAPAPRELESSELAGSAASQPGDLAPAAPEALAALSPSVELLQQYHFLDRRIAGVISVTADELNVDLLERVDGVVHNSPRSERFHALLTPAAGGANRPGLAYLLPLDRSERDRLLHNLRASLVGTSARISEADQPEVSLDGLARASTAQIDEVLPVSLAGPAGSLPLLADRTGSQPNDFGPAIDLFQMLDESLLPTISPQKDRFTLLRRILGIPSKPRQAELFLLKVQAD